MKRREVGPRHFVLPDCQVKPGVPTDHIAWAARYAASKRPDVIACLGDFHDMPSLSSWDVGKKSAEGRRYRDDIEAGNAALALFERELKRYAPRSYRPRKVVVLGNHDDRITRAVEGDAKLEGTLSLNDLAWKRHGWEVHPFLKPATVHGVTYVHYCPLNATGRVSSGRYGAPSALAQARRMMATTICGHRQGLDVATVETPRGRVRGVIAGSFYQHEETYAGPMGNSHWQGVLMLNDIQNGDFDLCEISLDYLRRKWS